MGFKEASFNTIMMNSTTTSPEYEHQDPWGDMRTPPPVFKSSPSEAPSEKIIQHSNNAGTNFIKGGAARTLSFKKVKVTHTDNDKETFSDSELRKLPNFWEKILPTDKIYERTPLIFARMECMCLTTVYMHTYSAILSGKSTRGSIGCLTRAINMLLNATLIALVENILGCRRRTTTIRCRRQRFAALVCRSTWTSTVSFLQDFGCLRMMESRIDRENKQSSAPCWKSCYFLFGVDHFKSAWLLNSQRGF